MAKQDEARQGEQATHQETSNRAQGTRNSIQAQVRKESREGETSLGPKACRSVRESVLANPPTLFVRSIFAQLMELIECTKSRHCIRSTCANFLGECLGEATRCYNSVLGLKRAIKSFPQCNTYVHKIAMHIFINIYIYIYIYIYIDKGV